MVEPGSNVSSDGSTESTDTAAVCQPQNLPNGSTSESGGFTPNWQSSKRKMEEHFEHLFTNQLQCDVQFVVGPGPETQKIGAHKTILAGRSAVFFEMFSEKWSTDCREIRIPDVEPVPFIEMLRFLYSDKVSLTTETVTSVIYVAKKYDLVGLEDLCADFLQSQLCVENVFSILNQARLFNMKSLIDGCLEFIAEDTVGTLQTDDFCSIDVETLCLVLERSDLTISEIELFEAVIRWSKKACEKANLPINPENQRKVLKNSPSLLRFPLMNLEVFASKVVESGILLEADVISLFRSFTLTSKEYTSLFSRTPRGRPCTASRFKFETSGKTSFDSSDGTDLTTHKLIFSVSRDIRLMGIGLYGSPNHPVCYAVNITVTGYTANPNYHCSNDQRYLYSPTLMQSCGIYDCNSSNKIFRIMFKNPIALTATTKYFIEVKIQGKVFVYGCGGSASLTVNNDPERKVTFTFESKETVSTEQQRGIMTDVNSGQIPEFLFEV